MCTFYSCFDGLLSAIWYLDSVSTSYKSQENGFRRKTRFGGKIIFHVFAEKFCFVILAGILFFGLAKKTQYCGLAKKTQFCS